jgi:hypothetical protein
MARGESQSRKEIEEFLMNKFLGFAVFFIFLGGCSSSTIETVGTTNSNTSDNSFVINSAAKSENINAADSTKTEEPINADSSQSVLPQSPEFLDYKNKKGGKGKGVNVAPIDPNATRFLSPAPDNSEITTEMNKQGQPIETRTFKSNPLLAKVERIYTTMDNPTVRIYLKNGKIINLSKGKIDNIFSASAQEILNAVGAVPQNDNSLLKENMEKKEKQ